ncbi:hypothetical protein ABEB36_014470 [Hypothenemus hampei]|uniref:Uncharacterized protein n=1 Tax=Hypothenemus hampei TaxID=57062 RepID=A0ABD1E260_HYPHA
MQKAIRTLNEEDDQYDIFGKYVASEMRDLSSEYLRKKLKRKIQQVVLEISGEEELLSNPSPHNYSNPNSVGSISQYFDSASTSAEELVTLQPSQSNSNSVGSVSEYFDSESTSLEELVTQ